jgi:hypothetical protein
VSHKCPGFSDCCVRTALRFSAFLGFLGMHKKHRLLKKWLIEQ